MTGRNPGGVPLHELFPERWPVSRFGVLFREVNERNGSDPVGEPLSVSEYHGVILRDGASGQMAAEDISIYRVVRPGQLAANMMWLNRSGLGVSELTGYVSPAYKVFSISDSIAPRFADYLLRSTLFRAVFESLGRGVRPNAQMVDTADLRSTPIPHPAVDEQVAISDFLDGETAKIDALIAKQNELIALLRVRRRHTIELAVNPLTVPDWERQPLKRLLARIDQGISPDTSSATEDAVFWVLKTGASNHGIFDEQESKPVPDSVTVPRHIEVMTGDLVVSRASGSPDLVGSAAVVGKLTRRLILSDKNFRLVPASTVDARFLYWALNSPNYRSQVRLAISGADGLANNLPLSSLRRIRLWLPQLPEQRQIAQRLDHETTKIDALIGKAEKHIALAQERRAALITAAVTGQIDVTGKVT